MTTAYMVKDTKENRLKWWCAWSTKEEAERWVSILGCDKVVEVNIEEVNHSPS